MSDYQHSSNGYWIDPTGVIHDMVGWQVHAEWIASHLNFNTIFGQHDAPIQAINDGWVRVTFAGNGGGFDTSFDSEKVSKAAIRAVRKILKDHNPENNICINNSKFDLMRDADRELSRYPMVHVAKVAVPPNETVVSEQVVKDKPVITRQEEARKSYNSNERQLELSQQFVERTSENARSRYFIHRPMAMHHVRLMNGGDWERHELMGVPNYGYHHPHHYGDRVYFAAGGITDEVTPHYVDFRTDGRWYAHVHNRSHDRYNSYGEMYVAMLRLITGLAKDIRSISEFGFMEIEYNGRVIRTEMPERKGTPVPSWALR